MLYRILSILGWVGTALVFGAVAVRFVRPEWDQYATWSAWAGLALVVLYTLGQWREILEYFQRRQARYSAVAALGVLVALAITVAVNYLGARQNKRWDLTASRQYSLSEQTVSILQSLEAPVKFTVFDRQIEIDRFRNRLDEYVYNSRQVSVEYIDSDMRPVVARGVRRPVVRHGRRGLHGPPRTRDVGRRAGSDQCAHQGHVHDGAQGVLSAGARRKGTQRHRARRLQRR